MATVNTSDLHSLTIKKKLKSWSGDSLPHNVLKIKNIYLTHVEQSELNLSKNKVRARTEIPTYIFITPLCALHEPCHLLVKILHYIIFIP